MLPCFSSYFSCWKQNIRCHCYFKLNLLCDWFCGKVGTWSCTNDYHVILLLVVIEALSHVVVTPVTMVIRTLNFDFSWLIKEWHEFSISLVKFHRKMWLKCRLRPVAVWYFEPCKEMWSWMFHVCLLSQKNVWSVLKHSSNKKCQTNMSAKRSDNVKLTNVVQQCWNV